MTGSKQIAAVLWFVASGVLVTVTTLLARIGTESLHPVDATFFQNILGLVSVVPVPWRQRIGERVRFSLDGRSLYGRGRVALLSPPRAISFWRRPNSKTAKT